MRSLVLVVTVLVVAGCAPLDQFGRPASAVDQYRQLLTACKTYSAGLKTLAAFNSAGKLSAGDVATVDLIRAVANPICGASTPPADLGLALGTLEDVADEMLAMQLKAGA